MGAGFGELEAEDVTALSVATGAPLSEAGIPAVNDERFRACVKALIPDARGKDCGDCGGNTSPTFCNGPPRAGDSESDPALKG